MKAIEFTTLKKVVAALSTLTVLLSISNVVFNKDSEIPGITILLGVIGTITLLSVAYMIISYVTVPKELRKDMI